MRFLSWTSAALLLLLAAGCSESHGVTSDAGPGTDSGPNFDDGGCVGLPTLACYYDTEHVCGDVVEMQVCAAREWVCPPGTRLDAECWCFGNEPHRPECGCTVDGWECPPPGCPADPISAEGTPCSMEGQSCGTCGDPCGWCNILQCTGGRWTRLEAPPPEPGTCDSFDCGPDLRCVRGEQYCSHVVSDIGGEPDGYTCSPMDASCTAHDCTCFAGIGWSCEDDGEGAIILTTGGG